MKRIALKSCLDYGLVSVIVFIVLSLSAITGCDQGTTVTPTTTTAETAVEKTAVTTPPGELI